MERNWQVEGPQNVGKGTGETAVMTGVLEMKKM